VRGKSTTRCVWPTSEQASGVTTSRPAPGFVSA
jgi:hypothetical protein